MKHLVDIDDDLLATARAELGTRTIKDTVNEALRLASVDRRRRVSAALRTLADAPHEDRESAWR